MKKITDSTMEEIVSYMDDEIREELNFKMAPCTNEEFLKAYVERVPDFSELLENEFSIDIEVID